MMMDVGLTPSKKDNKDRRCKICKCFLRDSNYENICGPCELTKILKTGKRKLRRE